VIMSDDARAVDVVNVTVAEAVPDTTAVVMLSAVAAAVTQPTHGVDMNVGILSTDVSILIPVAEVGFAVMALFAFKLSPVHVIDTREPALISVFTVTASDVADKKEALELLEATPQDALGDSVLNVSDGKVSVMIPPIARSDEMLNVRVAEPPEPTAVDMMIPVIVVLRQPIHGLESIFTSKGVSFSNTLASAKLATL